MCVTDAGEVKTKKNLLKLDPLSGILSLEIQHIAFFREKNPNKPQKMVVPCHPADPKEQIASSRGVQLCPAPKRKLL